MSDPDERDRLIHDARAVLASNDLGASTKPAPDLYPHQWNWDSCFIAIGISRYDTARACEEIRSLLRGQWKNGLVPQIVFNPHATGYFPGADVWQSKRSADAPREVDTSGITQPPVLAIAALEIWNSATDKELARRFLVETYPAIVRYHEFLYSERDPDGDGLVVVVHPWESGLDNSPPYLDAGKRVRLAYKPQYTRLDTRHVDAKNRPTDKDYDLFVYLLELMRAVDWNQREYLRTAPLQIEDVLFNSVLCRANECLARIAEIVSENPTFALEWKAKTERAVNEKLWNDTDQTYYCFDRVAGQLVRTNTIASLHTLYGGIPSQERARSLTTLHLTDPRQFWPEKGNVIPTTSLDSPWFNPINYWLGPVWVNTNWMVMQGLSRYGFELEALRVREDTLKLVASGGFREYFDPRSGVGYGTNSFSWTAALILDLVESNTPRT